MTITAISNTPGLIPNPIGVNYTNPSTTGTLTFTPVAGAIGTATVTVTVTDNLGLATQRHTFTVTVTANKAPTLDALGNVSVHRERPHDEDG